MAVANPQYNHVELKADNSGTRIEITGTNIRFYTGDQCVIDADCNGAVQVRGEEVEINKEVYNQLLQWLQTSVAPTLPRPNLRLVSFS